MSDSYKLTHNTLWEAARIVVVESATLVLAAVTIPWRLLRRKKP